MPKRDKHRFVPWLAVIVCGSALALTVKFIAEEKGISAGSSNLLFILIWALAILAYLLFNVIWEPLFEKILGKKLTPKQKQEEMHGQEGQPDLPEGSELRGKVESFCRYSDDVLSGYVSDEDMKLLHSYIAQYAKGDMGDISQKIKTTGPDTFDLCHYGWNIWHHFRIVQQPETAQWLINVFASLDGFNPNTLSKKFTHNERYSYKIEINDKIK